MSETVAAEVVRAALTSQLRAALAMLRQAVERCPDDLWDREGDLARSWQIAYHALFFAHLYAQPRSEDFVPWAHHVANVQYDDGIPGPPDPKSELPLVAPAYTKAQILAYWEECDRLVGRAIGACDVASASSGFSWYPIPKLEHLILNVRHVEHHVAQLAARLRSEADVGIDWVGAKRDPS